MSLLLLFGADGAAPSVVSLAASGTNALTGAARLQTESVVSLTAHGEQGLDAAARLRSGIVTFGRTTENTSTLAAVAAKLHGTRFTLGASAAIDVVYARLSNTGTWHQACAAKAAIYSSSGGEPDKLLGYSANVVIADNLALQWVEFEFSSAVILGAGTYFIAIWVNYDGVGVQLRYLNLQGKTYYRDYSSSGAPPDPFGAVSEDFYMLELDIYAMGEAVPDSLTAYGEQGLEGSADLAVTTDMVARGEQGLDGRADITVATAGTAEMAARGEQGLDGSADLTIEERMAAYGVSGLTGSAWLTLREHGQDTLTAHGRSRQTGTARLLDAGVGASLPPTDTDGWTAPDATPSDLLGLKVTIAGLGIVPAQITDLTIDLDTEGGPKAATVGLNCALDRAPRLGRTKLIVTYKARTLFRGRLEHIVGDVSSTTGYDLTFAGPLVTLRDHKAYRTVFVDSDLDSWRTDQGANTDQNSIFTTSHDEGGLSVTVMQYASGD